MGAVVLCTNESGNAQLGPNQGRRHGFTGGGTISRGDRPKKIFSDPHLLHTWGYMKQNIAQFSLS